jgi:ElaB/YqjD/DUF883 family membrane-anchored ribosome-binding protein
VDDSLKALVNDTVRQQLAAQVLQRITTKDRDAILRASIEKALKEWSTQYEVEKAVAKQAAIAAEELLKTPEWKAAVRQAVNVTLGHLVDRLPAAMQLALQEAFFGKDGGAHDTKPGLILKHLKERP